MFLYKVFITLLLPISIFGGIEMNVKECGNKPNCVSSVDKRDEFKIEPLKVDSKDAFEKIKQDILKMNRAKLIKEDQFSAHFVFTTKLMRFKDDLHLFFDQINKTVHISSRSRVGYSDWGVNKERVEQVRGLTK